MDDAFVATEVFVVVLLLVLLVVAAEVELAAKDIFVVGVVFVLELVLVLLMLVDLVAVLHATHISQRLELGF